MKMSENKRRQWTVTINKEEHTFASKTEACAVYKITPQCFNQRVNQYGWSVEKALTTPVKMSLLERTVKNELDLRGYSYIQNRAIRNIVTTSTDYEIGKMIQVGKRYNPKAMEQFNPLSRYDFLIKSGQDIIVVIECDGALYFRPSMRQWDLNLIRVIDLAKDAFMEANQIPLLRIRYDQISQIPELIDDLLLHKEFYIMRHSRLSNYYGGIKQ